MSHALHGTEGLTFALVEVINPLGKLDTCL